MSLLARRCFSLDSACPPWTVQVVTEVSVPPVLQLLCSYILENTNRGSVSFGVIEIQLNFSYSYLQGTPSSRSASSGFFFRSISQFGNTVQVLSGPSLTF